MNPGFWVMMALGALGTLAVQRRSLVESVGGYLVCGLFVVAFFSIGLVLSGDGPGLYPLLLGNLIGAGIMTGIGIARRKRRGRR